MFSLMSAWVLQEAYVPARGVSSFAVARREVHKSGVQSHQTSGVNPRNAVAMKCGVTNVGKEGNRCARSMTPP